MATATPSNCGTVTPTYFWDFGDGTTSTQQNPSKIYTTPSAPGTYTWTLTTTVGAGLMIDTIVGGPGENIPANQASFGTIAAIARDPQGRGIYIADVTRDGTFIRFINTSGSPVTLGVRTIAPGTVRTIAGGGSDFTNDNVSAFQANVGDVSGLAVSTGSDLVYYIDKVGGVVRAVNVSSGPVNVRGQSTGVGNVRTLANSDDFPQFPELFGLTTTANGDVYVIDSTVNKVYRIASSGVVATFAGNGASTMSGDPFPGGTPPATGIPLLQPRAVKADGANIYIADSGHRRVIRVTGGNAALVRQFAAIDSIGNPFPSGIAVRGGEVYVTNGNEKAVYRASNNGPKIAGITNGIGDPVPCDYSSNLCGDGGPASNAGLNLLGSTDEPPTAGVDSDGDGLFVADQRSKGRVRYINLSGGTVTILGVPIAAAAINTIAGTGRDNPYDLGLAKGSELSNPTGVAIDGDGNLWISDTNDDRLRFVNRGSSQVTIFSGTPAVQTVPAGAIVTVNKDRGTGSGDDLPVNQASFVKPQGLFVTSQGVYIVDSLGGVLVPAQTGNDTSLVRFINTTTTNVTIFPGAGGSSITVPPGNIMTVAGGGISDLVNGFATAVTLKGVSDIAVAGNGTIYVTDVNRKAVRKIDGNSGQVTPLTLPAAKEYTGLGFTTDGRLLVANFTDGTVHRESTAGGGSFATFGGLGGNLANIRDVAGAAAGTAVAVTGTPPGTNGLPTGNHRIVQISSTGSTSPLAGATPGFDGDGGASTAGRLNTAPPKLVLSSINNVTTPETVNIVVDINGDILFTDTNNNRVRRISGISCTQTGQISITGNNPAPTLTGINPTSRMQGATGFILTATGTNFSPSSVVRWNGSPRPSTYIDSTQLTASIPMSDLATPGTAAVTVFTPTPGGGTSLPQTFTIIGPNPTPTITSLSPASAPEGSGPLTLTVNGTMFVNGAKVRLEGAEVPTTFVNSTRLTAQLGVGDLIGVGQVNVTVLNPPPPPGGAVSAPAIFNITPAACPNPATNPVPALSVLGPPAVGVGHPAFKLFVTGNNFVCTSKVRINNVERDTTVFSGTMLAANILASDVASLGNKPVTIVSPAHTGMSDGGTSAVVNLRVMPKFTTVSAASFAANPVPQTADSIAAGFGTGLANGTTFATTNPLPNILNGTEVRVTDMAGVERQAGLFFASGPANQVNYQMPPGMADGLATAVVYLNGAIVAAGPVNITSLSPGLFTFPGTGNGVVAGVALRAFPNGTQTTELIFDFTNGTFVPRPLVLNPPAQDALFLLVFGTGMRNNSGPANIIVDFGNGKTKALRADFSEGCFAVPGLVSLDQCNIFLPRDLLMGSGLINMKLTIDGKMTNTVQFAVQ